MRLIANYPNGETETLISVPEYDFDWQLFYYPSRHVSLPAGTRLDIVAHYNNSASNLRNPDPDVPIRFGTQTTTPATDETRRDALLVSLPGDTTYSVELPMGRRTFPTALHLPKDGEGTWYIPMRGTLVVIPVENVAWDGNGYTFDM